MAERKKLGCFSAIAIVIGAGLIASAVSGNRDSSESSLPSQTTPVAEASQTQEPKETEAPVETKEPKTEVEIQTERVCAVAQSGHAIVTRIIKGIATGSGDIKYTDKDYVASSIKTLTKLLEENPEIDEDLASAIREQTQLMQKIVTQFVAIENYDDVNLYLSDFSRVNQDYVRNQKTSKICGY